MPRRSLHTVEPIRPGDLAEHGWDALGDPKGFVVLMDGEPTGACLYIDDGSGLYVPFIWAHDDPDSIMALLLEVCRVARSRDYRTIEVSVMFQMAHVLSAIQSRFDTRFGTCIVEIACGAFPIEPRTEERVCLRTPFRSGSCARSPLPLRLGGASASLS
jgi:hypothetical protein